MAPLQNAKEWFKKRRGKGRRNTPNNNSTNGAQEAYIPGIGYPPMRNSSQPTLIPYIPPAANASSEHKSDNDSEVELELEHHVRASQDMRSAATTTCLGISSRSAVLLAAAQAADSKENDCCCCHQVGPAQCSVESVTTLVPSSLPDRRSSLQLKAITATSGIAHIKNGSHTSLPVQMLPRENIAQELKSCPQLGQGRHSLSRNLKYLNNRHQRASTPPQPRTHSEVQSNAMGSLSTRFTASTETLSATETKAQEYARTVKTLWQMVEDEELSYRLADASPVEREWLIFNHKNAKFPLKPSVVPTSETRASSESARCRNGHHHGGRGDPKLARIDEAGHVVESSEKSASFHHRRGCPFSKAGVHLSHEDENSDGQAQPVMMSLPNSPTASPVDSSSEHAKEERRRTWLSPMVLQSAQELQKRDHFTIQQRVDMEEDWRMQARLLRSVGEHEDRARGVRKVHEQLVQRQQRQRDTQEYEPTHQDFNRWYDLKEEIEDDAVPDVLNDNIQGFDLKEELEDEEERKQREQVECEARKRQELEELEHELNILGIDRFDGLCMSFVESDGSAARVPQLAQQQCSPEELQERQQQLQQQLQHQYYQLQQQLQLQHHTVRSPNKASRKMQSGTVPSLVPIAPPSGPGPTSQMILHEPRPLRPRNGRRLFPTECCDSMIITDMPTMMSAAPTRIH